MIKVQTYQTEDGKLHTSKLAALRHERFLQIRGLIQQGVDDVPRRRETLNLNEAVEIITFHAENLTKIFGQYKSQINRAIRSK